MYTFWMDQFNYWFSFLDLETVSMLLVWLLMLSSWICFNQMSFSRSETHWNWFMYASTIDSINSRLVLISQVCKYALFQKFKLKFALWSSACCICLNVVGVKPLRIKFDCVTLLSKLYRNPSIHSVVWWHFLIIKGIFQFYVFSDI